MDKQYCPCCKKEVSTDIRKVTESYTIKGQEMTVESNIRFCKNCESPILDEALDQKNIEKVYSLYRQENGLLTPEQIKNIRLKYGVTQVTFAKILGLGDKTIARYENGSLQDAAQNSLIFLAKIPSNFKILFEKNKQLLSENESKCLADRLSKLTTEKTAKMESINYKNDYQKRYKIPMSNIIYLDNRDLQEM